MKQFRLSDSEVLIQLFVFLMLSLFLSVRELCAALLINQTAIPFVHLEATLSDSKIKRGISSDIAGLSTIVAFNPALV